MQTANILKNKTILIENNQFFETIKIRRFGIKQPYFKILAEI